jgi:hypothetical protein
MSTDKVKSRVTSTDMTATTLDDVFESGTVRQDEYFDDEQIYNDVRDFENDDLLNRADAVYDSSVAAVSSGLDEDADESNLEENNKLCSDEADNPNILQTIASQTLYPYLYRYRPDLLESAVIKKLRR